MSQTDSPLPRSRAKAARHSLSGSLERMLPRLVIAPSLAVALFFVYGYMLWTFVLSLTDSGMLPQYDFIGFA
ncbi:MAG: sugar ABC transporter permease, partial [Chromohalobacter sp.]|nr:sugar ABC transporter permease [Chromohalobacter sp.]